MTGERRRSGRLVSLFAIVTAGATLQPVAALAQNALQLGSGTAYVTFGDPAKLKLSQFTVETWFRRDGTGTGASTGTGGIASLLPLVTKGAAQAEGSNVDANFILGIDTAGDVIAADFEEGAAGASPGLNHPVSGVTPIVNGVWYHAAATYDGSTWQLYLNGVLEAELLVGQPVRDDSIQHAALGTTIRSDGVTVQGHFDGTLDEARIWSVARSAADIRTDINAQLTSGTNLVARWGLDDGAGTTVADSIAPTADGTIVGTGSAWVAGAPFDLATCSNNDNVMLRFDGTNDYVTFGNAAELGLSTFTVETWFVRTGAGTGNTTGSGGIASLVPLVTKGAPESDGSNVDANYILGIDTAGNVLAADFEDTATGLNHPISGTTPIVNNRWYHAAATYDGSTWQLYLNGAPEATLVVGAFTPRSDSIQHAALGAMLTSTGTRLGAFAGVLDEVRIWNFAKSGSQVAAEYQQQITSAPGLVARWGLDEGSGTSTADSTGAPFTTGTLTNGPLWTRSNSLFSRIAACSDTVFCNGPDTCNGDGLRCVVHAGDPCTGGSECADSCNEAADDCFDLAGTPCTDDGEICTDDECDGAGSCAHPAGNPGALCRSGSGDSCDPDELCDGFSPTCPADVVSSNGTICRMGSGDQCDPDETCTGVATDPCPADAVEPSSTTCRPVAGACDVAENCTGVATDPCPADAVEPSSTTCRPAAGDCDVAENCDGATVDCPADAFEPASTECRPAVDACDVAENCTGTDASCPADTGLPDTDGDTVCDAIDNCDAIANPGQENADADALGDACDPCTNVVPTTQDKAKLTLTKLLAPTGDEKVTFKGFFLSMPTSPTIDPVANGLRFLITDSTGATPVDATLPGGAYDPVSKAGWKVNGAGTAWTYKNTGKIVPLVDGIQKAQLKTIPSTPGKYKFSVKGKNGTYAINTANLPLVGTIVIDVPYAATGQCGEAQFTATPPAKPSCVLAGGGKTVKCK
jgi:hypothetical protein